MEKKHTKPAFIVLGILLVIGDADTGSRAASCRNDPALGLALGAIFVSPAAFSYISRKNRGSETSKAEENLSN